MVRRRRHPPRHPGLPGTGLGFGGRRCTGDFGYFKFAPTAVAVTPGTTVQWGWTGEGGAHDVVALEGAFDSGEPVRSETETFEYTFDQPAIYKYYCTPHRQQGMRGAVFVALAD